MKSLLIFEASIKDRQHIHRNNGCTYSKIWTYDSGGTTYVCIYMYIHAGVQGRSEHRHRLHMLQYKVACQLDALQAFILSIICLCRFNSTGSARTYPSSTTLHGKKRGLKLQGFYLGGRRGRGTLAPLPNGRPCNIFFFFVFVQYQYFSDCMFFFLFFFSSFSLQSERFMFQALRVSLLSRSIKLGVISSIIFFFSCLEAITLRNCSIKGALFALQHSIAAARWKHLVRMILSVIHSTKDFTWQLQYMGYSIVTENRFVFGLRIGCLYLTVAPTFSPPRP